MRNRTPAPHTDSASPAAWYRQPVLWLGAFVLLASLAGCVWLIVMAQRHPDPVLDEVGMKILRMPLEAAPVRTAAPPR